MTKKLKSAVSSNANQSPTGPGGTFTLESALVPPDADGDTRFHLEFFQDVFHVFLDGARAASKNLADLAVALSGGDPFHYFVLTLG